MDSFFRMRRSSHAPSANQEPLIVVEESENLEKEEEISHTSSPRQSLDIDSPENPYLLSPWRDPRETRKHSLPTPPCTSGITASQVRRLSDQARGPSPREQAFLATLYSSPAPQPGGRRHSVVTICKVPPTIFSRNRRESIAALPAGQRSTASSRRESKTGPPPSTDHRGSIHNLQLDIMDDIVQARKARMKLWNTSNEKVCEVQTLDEAGAGSSSPMRYTNRRFSDFVGTTLPPIQSFRRASELPVSPSGPLTPATTSSKQIVTSPNTTLKSGIVCTNTDLISLLSSLASSATELNRCGDKDYPTPQTPQSSSSFKSMTKLPPDQHASGSDLKKNRSNSFDISLYQNIKQLATGSSSSTAESSVEPGWWFANRHTPAMARRKSVKSNNTSVSFAKEAIDKLRDKTDTKAGDSKPKAKETRSPLSKLKWDGRSMVDAKMIGNAIENFITGSSSSKKSSSSKETSSKTSKKLSSSSWFGKTDDDDSNDTCDSSLCSTLKDLFVK